MYLPLRLPTDSETSTAISRALQDASADNAARQCQPVRLAQGNDFCVPAVFARKRLSDEEPPALVLVCAHVHGREDALRTPRTLSVLDKRSANVQTLKGRKDRIQRRR